MTLRIGLAAIPCVFGLLGGGCGSTPGALSEADLASIREVSDEFSRSVVASDWAAVGRLYTQDAVLMPPGAPSVRGRPDAVAALATLPKATEMNLTLEAIDGRGDLAFVRGSYQMTVAVPGASEPVKDKGKFVEVRRKQPDGRWLIAVDIFNSDYPASPPEPPPESPGER